jgi:16S rRNA (guanine966-N2)-methyltransferase
MTPRITSGSLGSRKLKSPKGMQVRPTPGRVKESLFSILAERVDGARVLDLFAGTGAIGFEAASRNCDRNRRSGQGAGR